MFRKTLSGQGHPCCVAIARSTRLFEKRTGNTIEASRLKASYDATSWCLVPCSPDTACFNVRGHVPRKKSDELPDFDEREFSA